MAIAFTLLLSRAFAFLAMAAAALDHYSTLTASSQAFAATLELGMAFEAELVAIVITDYFALKSFVIAQAIVGWNKPDRK